MPKQCGRKQQRGKCHLLMNGARQQPCYTGHTLTTISHQFLMRIMTAIDALELMNKGKSSLSLLMIVGVALTAIDRLDKGDIIGHIVDRLKRRHRRHHWQRLHRPSTPLPFSSLVVNAHERPRRLSKNANTQSDQRQWTMPSL